MSWDTIESSSYTMNNRLCSGLTANALAALELQEFQKRVRIDERYRHAIQQLLMEALYAVQSRTSVEPFSLFASNFTDYAINWLSNTGMLEKVYHISNVVTFEDEPEEKPEVKITMFRKIDDMLEALAEIQPYFIEPFGPDGEYYVFNGEYALTIEAEGYETTRIDIITKSDIQDIVIATRLIHEIPEPEVN